MEYQHSLSSLLDMHIYDVSKTRIKLSNETINYIKSLHYNQFITLINQFIPDMNCLSVKDYNNYKGYPLCIRKDVNGTTLTGIEPTAMFDNIVCLNNKIVFVPIIGEYITYDRRLHQMTLVFNANNNTVFLHDPNSKSMFNDSTTLKLLQDYIHTLNTILNEYGMPSYTFHNYEFSNMNININFMFADSIKGNCVVASIVFMILYQEVQDASCIEMILQQTNKDEYKKVYISMYNKLQEYITLFT